MSGILSIQSHVVYGRAGNSSAIFPLQRMGFDVWPIHTVQFSNHTQYEQGWTGRAFAAEDITQLVSGIDKIGKLGQCQAVLSGYQGSAEQCEAVIDTVKRVKERNPEAIYTCDPVMGDPAKGCIVAPGVAEVLINQVMPMADIIVPNQYELTQFTGIEINDLQDAITACQVALSKGPKLVVVKHLHSVSKDKFTMMMASKDGAWLAERPYLDFAKQPVGVGDLISALFTGKYLSSQNSRLAFEFCNNASFSVLEKTYQLNEWELQTIAAQDDIFFPKNKYKLQKVAYFGK
ncbi:pyridoxal kinase PdxY [Photobacterium rosenbergii]|uniref:pyridoxal kinase PdxY n=1 Tax=Photobacterium rosenbergii TaxID=294936 RepID=UPI001C99651B|nr:pyridoxal kinase PdxY [Photobacterium rosenbergii]MBY5947785.1 pyridoxal kinase PdxY [Photobacterium rosenbergii]